MSLQNVVPTKANLMKTKSSLVFAKKGYELLDKKRTVLIREMMNLNKRAKDLQDRIEEELLGSFEAFNEATMTMGSDNISDIASSMKLEDPYEIQFHSVMGVEILKIRYKKEELRTEYGFFGTTAAFDNANLKMHEIRYLIYELAEVEIAVFRLAEEIKKTQKRANALDKIQIPKFTVIVKSIENTLAEKEREDFFRLKKVKGLKEKKEIAEAKKEKEKIKVVAAKENLP